MPLAAPMIPDGPKRSLLRSESIILAFKQALRRMATYKNSWAQGWTAKGSKEPNPPAPATRPAARGVSDPFLQDILPDFCKKSAQRRGGTLGQLQILLHPARILPPLVRLLLHPRVLFFGSKMVSENYQKNASTRPSILPQQLRKTYFFRYFCDFFLKYSWV